MKNKMLRIAAMLLSLLMLLSAISACDKTGSGGEATTGEEVKTVSIDLSEYRVVRPENASTVLVDAAVSVRKALEGLTGSRVEIRDDWLKEGVTAEIEEMKEVLIGATNRSASAAALEKAAESTSFVIAVIGNKVVVSGGTDSAVKNGTDYFIENILSAAEGTVITLPENFVYVSEPIPALEIVAAQKCPYSIVYADGLDNSKKADNDKDAYDLEVDLSRKIRTKIASLTGLAELDIRLETDWAKKDEDTSAKKEILVGRTGRPESVQFLESIAYDEYGFAVIGNKVVVAGHNLTTTEQAVNKFLTFLQSAVSGAAGDKRLILFADLRVVEKHTGWLADIPAYEGGKLAGSQDAGYGNLQIFISDTNADEFRAYRAKLEKEGYELFEENEINGNLFATYTGAKGEIHTYYVPYDKMTHIVTCPAGQYELPASRTPAEVPAYTKVTESRITQMNLNYAAGNFGMCYVITLEDGSFIVFDGGGYAANYGDDQRLYDLLRELNTRPDGKIVIAGWFLTHEHYDHFTNFQNFMSRFGQKVELEYCFLNTPSKNEVINAYNPNYYVEKHLSGFTSAIGKPKIVKLHSGMKFYLRNAEFEVLFTQEDLFPKRCDFFNEGSMITRMKIAGQSVIWFGDTRNYGSAALCNRYGEYVKSDICQVAHHGYDGATIKVYRLISPETLLWPTSVANYTSQTAGTKMDGYFGTDYTISHAANVKSIIVAEPTQTITLPYHAGDPIVTNQH